MNEVQGSAIVTRFGTFEVNFQSRELRKHGMPIRLEESPSKSWRCYWTELVML